MKGAMNGWPRLIAAGLSLLTVPAFSAGAAPPERETYGQRLHAMIQKNPSLEQSPIGVLVRFDAGTTQAQRAHALAAVAGRSVERYSLVDGLELVEVSGNVPQMVARLERLPFVRYAEPDTVMRPATTPDDPFFAMQWGLNNTAQSVNRTRGTPGADIRAVDAWTVTTGNPDFAIAVIDTGIDYNHPDLAPNIWTNPGEMGLDGDGNARAGNGIDDDNNGFVDDWRGWDFVEGDNDPFDGTQPGMGHGTHVAGIIGASGDDGYGIAGVNWRCKLMALKTIGAMSNSILSLQYAVLMGARVSNNSYGNTLFSQAHFDALLASRNAGHLFVAAAGNQATDNDLTPFYPASYDLDNIISVAATDSRDRIAGFSNWGLASVDLGAPGVNVYSTYYYGTPPYASLSGTSMATPHVVGVAALVWGMHPDWTYAQVKERLLATVRPISDLQGITVTGGVVNATAAVGVPPAPSGLTAVKIATGTARLTWQDNSVAETGFELERQKKIGKTWGGTTTLTAGPDVTTLTDAPGAGSYRYRIRAVSDEVDSAWTAYVTVTL